MEQKKKEELILISSLVPCLILGAIIGAKNNKDNPALGAIYGLAIGSVVGVLISIVADAIINPKNVGNNSVGTNQ